MSWARPSVAVAGEGLSGRVASWRRPRILRGQAAQEPPEHELVVGVARVSNSRAILRVVAQRSRAARARDALIWGAASARAPARCWSTPAWLGALVGAAVVGPPTALAKPGALWGRMLAQRAADGADRRAARPRARLRCRRRSSAARSSALLGRAAGEARARARDRRRRRPRWSTSPRLAGAAHRRRLPPIAAFVYRKRPLVRIMAEAVPAEELRTSSRSRRARATSAPTTSSSSPSSRAGRSRATRPTSASSPRSTRWTARRSTRPRSTR